jgi:hypothetical protein
MANIDSSPDNRKVMEEKRAQWDVITAKRMEMINAEKKKQVDREDAERLRAEGEGASYYAEVDAAKVRGEEREEWRQDQHAKRAEDEKKRKALEAQQLLAAAEEKKRMAAEAERKGYMMNLHKVAIAHKIRDKRKAVEDEAQKEVKDATDSAERATHILDEETERSLNHLEADKQRRIGQIHSDTEHRSKAIEEKARLLNYEAEKDRRSAEEVARHLSDRAQAGEGINKARAEESQAKLRAESERRRDLSALEEQAANQIFTANEEAKHLKDEVLKNTGTKKLLILRQEGRKKQESEQRKENFEKWMKEG